MKNNSIVLDSEVVIVGAGVSGLVTARKLIMKMPYMKITLVEESNTIGGQVYQTQSMGDLGAKHISREHYHVITLLEEFDMEIYPKERSENLKKKSSLDDGIFSTLINHETNAIIREIDVKCPKYRFGIYKINEDDQKMDAFINSRLLFSKSKRYLRFLVRLVCGVEPNQVSVTEFMATCCSCNGLSSIINIYMNDCDYNYEFDTQALLKNLIEQTKEISIYTGCKITQIIQASDSYVLNDTAGNNFKTKVIVLAIPWNDVMNIYIYPELPKALSVPIFPSKYMISSFISQYDKPHWRERGYSGSSFYDGEMPLVCYEVDEWTLYGFILHNEDNLNMVDRTYICGTLSKIFCSEMQSPVAFAVNSFLQATILNLPQVSAHHHIIWGSSCASTAYRGLLDGAVQGGLRAALNVLAILYPQTVTYDDYKEVKRADAIFEKVGWWTDLTHSINVKKTTYWILGILGIYTAIRITIIFNK